ncbi:MAG: hypothetical protein DMG79_19760 [Acidobacteria bacterium]|nr:MAG: hypothetical protein DMG79_19760 [Acidobacteriota bacterium]
MSSPYYSLGAPTIFRRLLLNGGNVVARVTDSRLTSPRLPGKYIVQAAVFFVGYCIAGKLGQATINIRSSNLGPVWPAYGVALAAFLLCGYRIWPVILSATFLVAFFSPVTHLTALGQAAGSTLAALSGAFLLQRVAKFDKSLSRVRDALALIAFGALASALISASIGTLILCLADLLVGRCHRGTRYNSSGVNPSQLSENSGQPQTDRIACSFTVTHRCVLSDLW